MDSKLVEEIETELSDLQKLYGASKPDIPREVAMQTFNRHAQLFERCLESLRWIPIDQSAPNKFIGLLKDGGWGVFHKPKEPEDFQKMIDVYGIVGWMIPPTIAGE